MVDTMDKALMQPEFPALTALLIEDNPTVGDLTLRRLRKLFGDVRWALTGPEGLDLYHAQRPDMLLVDQLLPGCLGSDVVREIRTTDPDLLIVGITASAMGGEVEALETAGATLAFEKPVSLAQLREIATRFLAAQE